MQHWKMAQIFRAMNDNLEQNIAAIQKLFCNEASLIVRRILIGAKIPAAILFVDELTDKELINRDIVRPLLSAKIDSHLTGSALVDYLLQGVIYSSEADSFDDFNKITGLLLDGDMVLLLEGCGTGINLAVKKWDKRGVEEPPTSAVIRGPREGFNEDLKTNLTLLRRRLRTPDLMFDIMQIGKYSGTKVAVVYINSIADPKVIKQLKRKLESINIDGILDSSYVEAFITDNRKSIFQQVGITEKPDIAAGKLLEGRVCIVVDGSPSVLTVPFLFVENFQDSGDYYGNTLRKNFLRILRFISYIFAILLPGFYVSMLLFHYEMLPSDFLITVINSRAGIPMNPMLELIFTMMLFEILQEASVRMPKHIGTALSIVGGLILGETAVKAGSISSPAVVISAISAIAIYNVPEEAGIMNLLRFVFVILGGFIGFVGILMGVLVMCLHLLTLNSFGVPYMAPYAPVYPNDKQDALLLKPITQRFLRPDAIPSSNHVRMRHKFR